MDLLGELERRVVCGDGAMGTLLLNAGLPLKQCFEELCLSEPARIRKIHEDYIAAGAEVIATNTLGANAVRLARFGIENRVSEINRAAVAVAKSAAKDADVCIAGSVGPLGTNLHDAAARRHPSDCYREQITALLEAGVDVIFFETFTSLQEMEVALHAKNTLADTPAICSFACGPGRRLRCGKDLGEAIASVQRIGAKIVGLNCTNGPAEMADLLHRLPAESFLAVYPTAGNHTRDDGGVRYELSPAAFASSARQLTACGARLLGGCCGTTPAHIAALASMIQDLER